MERAPLRPVPRRRHRAGDVRQRRVTRRVQPRHCGKEPLGIRVPRMRKHLRHRAGLHHFAGVHHVDLARVGGYEPQVVGDEQHRHLPLVGDARDEVEHLLLGGNVQRRRRLVRHQQLRILRERRGNHHPLLLAAGKLAGMLLRGLRRQPHRLQELRDAAETVGTRTCAHPLLDLRADFHHRVERLHRVLEHVRDPRAAADLAGDLRAVDEAAERQRGQRLAAPGLAHERDASVLRHPKADLPHRHRDASLERELDAQILDFDQHTTPLSASRRPSPQPARRRGGTAARRPREPTA